jgi:hypothetical protein
MVKAEVISKNSSKDADRVRNQTAEELNQEIDHETQLNIRQVGSRGEIADRIANLDREWDVERYLQTNAALFALGGIILGATVNRKFLLLPGIVFPFLLQHSLQGWCPPLPVFRRLGIRTRKEVNRERYALKALRGDFQDIDNVTSTLKREE